MEVHFYCIVVIILAGSAQQPPVCSWYTSITSSCSISSAFGVSSSLILRPSNRNRRDVIGTPTLSAYDFFSLPICVVCFTRKWISLLSWPTTFSLMYSVSSPMVPVWVNAELESSQDGDLLPSAAVASPC